MYLLWEDEPVLRGLLPRPRRDLSRSSHAEGRRRRRLAQPPRVRSMMTARRGLRAQFFDPRGETRAKTQVCDAYCALRRTIARYIPSLWSIGWASG